MFDKIAYVSGALLFVGCLIYFPCQYLIYYPYFNLPWEESECIVNSISTSKIFWYQDKSRGRHDIDYTLIDVSVNVDGKWLQGFGCGCSKASASSAKGLINEAYPYQYTYCPKFSQCDDMIITPAWYCSDCKRCKEFLNTTLINCKYFLKKGNDIINDVDEISESYKIKYPTVDSTYIQVTFREHEFYIENVYIAMQIIGLGVMIILPASILIFIFLILVCKYTIRKYKNRRTKVQVIVKM
ncbi:unnamed protein product [Blepharisma stoltei]|uniref:Uncharacterized protein n=1 Tax=Blepharisma stoltei TaxID=1481888 RepID=A0AAU9JYL8_9CILI|nr:unnamed protein product [Blepharisma stoltei]